MKDQKDFTELVKSSRYQFQLARWSSAASERGEEMRKHPEQEAKHREVERLTQYICDLEEENRTLREQPAMGTDNVHLTVKCSGSWKRGDKLMTRLITSDEQVAISASECDVGRGNTWKQDLTINAEQLASCWHQGTGFVLEIGNSNQYWARNGHWRVNSPASRRNLQRRRASSAPRSRTPSRPSTPRSPRIPPKNRSSPLRDATAERLLFALPQISTDPANFLY